MLRQGRCEDVQEVFADEAPDEARGAEEAERKANEGQGMTWGDQPDEVLSHFATLGAFFLDLVRPDSFGNSGSGLKSQEVPFRARSSVG